MACNSDLPYQKINKYYLQTLLLFYEVRHKFIELGIGRLSPVHSDFVEIRASDSTKEAIENHYSVVSYCYRLQLLVFVSFLTKISKIKIY